MAEQISSPDPPASGSGRTVVWRYSYLARLANNEPIGSRWGGGEVQGEIMTQRQDGPIVDRDDPGVVRTNERVIGHTAPYDDRGHDDFVEVKNRVQFGPILAGVLTAIATMLILTVLGLAIGASALEPRDVGQSLGFGAAIWGIISAVIAFFLGGWVAAKTAAVAGAGSGLINGLMVGAAVLALLLWLTGTGVGALVGALGNNVGDIVDVVQEQGVSSAEAEQELNQVDENEAFDNVRDSAWGTLAGLIIPLAAAGLGGLAGQNKREDVIQRGR